MSPTTLAPSLRVPSVSPRPHDGVLSTLPPRVAVCGYGLLTPLGASASTTWDAILAGCAIEMHGEVAVSSRSGEPRVCTLAVHATREAIAAAGWTRDEIAQDATAIIVGTSKGPVDAWLTTPPEHMLTTTYESAGRDGVFGLAEVCDAVSRAIGAGGGPRLTLSAACASGLHALSRAWMMIRSRQVERAIVAAAESSLNPLFLASFRRLGVLPKDGIGCRPFDEARDGFLMSEAAAAVCLEGRETPAATDGDASGEVFVDRFALGGDATHLTGSDPYGRLLRNLIARVAGIGPIDLVHAHGTGTITNDPVELSAIDDTVHGAPNVFSHKAALGHSLGAAGLVSVALNCMAHARGIVPPNVRTTKPLHADHVKISHEAARRDVRRSIAIAAGFGGPTAVAALAS